MSYQQPSYFTFRKEGGRKKKRGIWARASKSSHADIVQGKKKGPDRFPRKKEKNVSQLPPGQNGIHIHSVGKCEGDGGEREKKGQRNPEGPHAVLPSRKRKNGRQLLCFDRGKKGRGYDAARLS